MGKCDFFFNSLNKAVVVEGILDYELFLVLKTYEEIRNVKIFKEGFLNHGDISTGNILSVGDEEYLIDFDETLVSSMLYDFAVIIIKLFVTENIVKKEEYEFFKNEIQKLYEYSDDDFKNAVKLYLCKILLEKFYLHYTKEIDLFSKRQQTDNYERYVNILIEFCEENNYV